MTEGRPATHEVERYFTIAPEMIIVAGFDGFWKHVNPAVESVLGYTEREALDRPFMEFVHPDDRGRTEEEARRVMGGANAFAFENRMVCKDGSYKWIEWTVTPVPAEGVMYGVGRDVTERRRSESQQAALQRIATLAAAAEQSRNLFAVVAEEVARVLDVPVVSVVRYGSDDTATECAVFPPDDAPLPTPRRWSLEGPSVLQLVRSSRDVARIDELQELESEAAASPHPGFGSSIGSPIVVGGRIWGVMVVSSKDESLPPDTESRLTQFTELMATAVANADARAEVQRLAEEQATLQALATLVADGVPPPEIFTAVSQAVARLFGTGLAVISRFDQDGPATIVMGVANGVEGMPVGSRWELDEGLAATAVYRTGRSARIDAVDWAVFSKPIGALARREGVVSTVSSPIHVEGLLWGTISVPAAEPLPPDTEERLEKFTQLVSSAISNAASRDALARLAAEQAALRRVATLVAGGAQPDEVFLALSDELARLFGTELVAVGRLEPDGRALDFVASDGGRDRVELADLLSSAEVFRTGRSVRADASRWESVEGDTAERLRSLGIGSIVSSPIVVEGEVWGIVNVGSSESVLPPDTEERLEKFTELAATAIANAESREARALLTDEQAALRQVATLVARDAPSTEVFETVAAEVGRLLEADATVVGRYDDDDGGLTAVASWSDSPGGAPVGTRSGVGGRKARTVVAETGKARRIDDYADASGEAADIARRYGWTSSIAAGITVEGRVWGAMLVARQRLEPFPQGAELRLAAFTDLVATALANTQAHDDLARFGEEQAALGRVATLVAGGAVPQRVFTAVVEEASRLLGLERIELTRYDGHATATVIAASAGHPFPPGTTWSLDGPSIVAAVARTRRAARIDDYTLLEGETARLRRTAGYRSAIGAPLTVEGQLWGVIVALSTDPDPIPERSEARLGQFTELVATAVANAEARDALARLADEQAALRRVATLVAQGAEPAAVFSAVGNEIARMLGSSMSAVGRFESSADETTLVIVGVGSGDAIEPGSRWRPDDLLPVARVLRTARSFRVDEMDWSAGGPVAELARRAGVVSIVASPIFVEGCLWGVMTACDTKRLPTGAEERLEKFSELIATAIGNAESSAELAASRRRIVTAADEARRRIERDLHDGTQQRLVSLGFALRSAEANLLPGQADLRDQLSDVASGLTAAVEDLQEISRGIHPAILAKGGLGPALRVLAERSAIPVDLALATEARFAEPIEVAVYYVASEALANAAKHSHASRIDISLRQRDGLLAFSIRDNGVGGADPSRGSGIIGLTDRIEALGGSIRVDSRSDKGTQITGELPLEPELP
jgi:PAS domain S-box-containing protein